MMTVFTINHLESNPLAEVKPPSREWLVQGTNELSAVEEARVSEIITRLRGLIAERRLLLLPFFKDFDRVCLYFFKKSDLRLICIFSVPWKPWTSYPLAL
jgi:hypothetical protein